MTLAPWASVDPHRSSSRAWALAALSRERLLALSQERQSQVDAVLARFFSLAKNRAAAFGPQYVELWQTLENNTIGGKRFRPRMVMCAYDALGGTDLEAAAYVGAAFELLHTALIVHDDVIDNSATRRGRDTASAVYGNTGSILAGDVLLAKAMRILAEDGDLAIIRTTSHSVVEMAEGEVRELETRLQFDLQNLVGLILSPCQPNCEFQKAEFRHLAWCLKRRSNFRY